MSLNSIVETESWCERNNPTIATLVPGSVNPVCTFWDGVQLSTPFVPNKVTSPQECTDVAPTWTYRVQISDYEAVNDFLKVFFKIISNIYLKVSVDSEAGLIWVKAMPGGPSPTTTYSITIKGLLPTGEMEEFILNVLITSCVVNPPTTVLDQSYSLTSPIGSYDAPDFTVTGDSMCPPTLQYWNTVTTNNFIDNNGGDGKYLSWQTADPANIALYTVTISASNLCMTATVSYTLEVVSFCSFQLLQIDPSDLKFTSPALVQNTEQAAQTLAWSEADVDFEYPALDCGPVEFELVTQSETVPDPSVITPGSLIDPRLLDVQTDDSAKSGIYLLRIRVKLTDWPSNPGATKDFTIQVKDLCENSPFDVTPSTPPADLEYTVGQSAVQTVPMDQFVWVPDSCARIYLTVVTPDPGDLTTFSFDGTSRIHTVETTDITKVGVYTVETRAVTPLGVDTGIGNSFQVTIIDPCKSAVLSFDSAIVPDTYEYVLFGTADIHSILVSGVTSSEMSVTCPPILLTVVKADLTAIDGDIFVHDAAAETLTSYSTDQLKIGLHPMKIQAQYSGAQYSVFSYDFTVTVIDPCLDHATLSPNPQTNPPDYLYTGSAPVADFTLTPFTVFPTFCTQTFTCLTQVGSPDICSIPGVSTFDAATGAYQIGTTDMATYVPGVYTLQITSTIGSVSSTVTFDQTLVNPCPAVTISLNPSPFSDVAEDLGAPETMQPWNLATIFTINTEVDCGNFDLEFYLNDGSQTPLNLAIFEDRRGVPNQFARKFVTDKTFVRSYEITYKIYMVAFPSVETEQTSPFTIEILASCLWPDTLDPSVLIDQEYTLTDSSVDYTFDVYPVTPDICDVTYTYMVSGGAVDPVISAFSSATQTFTFDHTMDLGPLGSVPFVDFNIYRVTVTGTAGLLTPQSVSQTFTLIVRNPCIDPSFVSIDKVALPAGLEYDLYSFDESLGFTFVHDPFTASTQPLVGHTLCGDIHYDVWFEGMLATDSTRPLRYDTLTRTFDIYSEDISLIGPRTFEVHAYFKDYPQVTSSTPNLVQTIEFLDPCASPVSLTDPGQNQSREYFYREDGLFFTIESFILTTPSCYVTYECISDSCQLGAVQFKPNGTMLFNTTDLVEYPPGEIEFTIRGTVGTLVPISTVATIKITLVNPCFTVTTSFKSQSPIEDMSYVLGRPEIPQKFDTLFELDVQVDCGQINFEFVYEDGSPIDETLFSAPSTDTDDRVFKVLQQRDARSVGIYKIRYRAILDSYPDVTPIELEDPFIVTIERAPSPSVNVFSVTPDWMSKLEDQYITQGDFLTYSFGENTNFFGTKTTVNVKMKQAGVFAEYSSTLHALVVDGTKVAENLLGKHRITVEATYVDSIGQTQFFSRSFYLYVEKASVTEDPVQEPEKVAPVKEQKKVTNFEGFKMFEPQPKNKERPIPYIVDFSQTGLMTIGWDRLMKPYEEPKEIPSQKIAVEPSLVENSGICSQGIVLDASEADEAEIREEVWFKEQIEKEEAEYRRMLLLDALQVQMEKDAETEELTDSVTDFTWDVIDFSNDFIWLQINFKNPQNLDSFSSKDYITVTFWGVDFFKSFQGVEVEFGKKLQWRILRQIRTDEKRQIDILTSVINSLLITGLLPMLLLIGLGGQLLPTWMFLNSLQLITHLPMINAHLPASLHYFLVNYLSLIRLDSEQIGDSVEAWQKERGVANYELIMDEDSVYSTLLNFCGYKHSFSLNLPVFIFVAMTMLLVVAGIFVWQSFKPRLCKQKTKRTMPRKQTSQYGAWTLNFSLRFVYEFFFEVCICVTINLASQKANANESILLWTIALLLGLFILAMVGFLVSLFWWGGPFTGSKQNKKNLLTVMCKRRSALCSQENNQSGPPTVELHAEKAVTMTMGDQNDAVDTERQLVAKTPTIVVDPVMTLSDKEQADKDQSEDERKDRQETSKFYRSSFSLNVSQNSSESEGVSSPCEKSKQSHELTVPIQDRLPVKQEQYWCEGGSIVAIHYHHGYLGHGNSIKSPEQAQQQDRIKKEARLRNSHADSVQPRLAYKTLFYGLKKNRNMAVVHPLAFVLRRMLYAVLILYFVQQGVYFGLLLLLASCLAMTAAVLHEAQWESQLINMQHFVNECFFYLLCISLILFNGVIQETEQVQTLSWLMIWCTCVMIIFNVIVILYDSVSYIRLLCQRHKPGIMKSIVWLKVAHPRQKESSKEQSFVSSIKAKKSKRPPGKEAEISHCVEEKVRENQVIDEELVVKRNLIESQIEAIPSRLSSSLILRRWDKDMMSIKDSSDNSYTVFSQSQVSQPDSQSRRAKILNGEIPDGSRQQPGSFQSKKDSLAQSNLLIKDEELASRPPSVKARHVLNDQPLLMPVSLDQFVSFELYRSQQESMSSFQDISQSESKRKSEESQLNSETLVLGRPEEEAWETNTLPLKLASPACKSPCQEAQKGPKDNSIDLSHPNPHQQMIRSPHDQMLRNYNSATRIKKRRSRNNSIKMTPTKAIREVQQLSIEQNTHSRDLQGPLHKISTTAGQNRLTDKRLTSLLDRNNRFGGGGSLTPHQHDIALYNQFSINNGSYTQNRRTKESCLAPERSQSFNQNNVLRQTNLDRAISELFEANSQRNAFMGYSNNESSQRPSQCSARPMINFRHERRKSFSPPQWQRVGHVTPVSLEREDFSAYMVPERTRNSLVSRADQRSSSSQSSSIILTGLNVLTKIDEIIQKNESRLKALQNLVQVHKQQQVD